MVLPGQQREVRQRATPTQGCFYPCSLRLDDPECCPGAAVALYPVDVRDLAELAYLSLVVGSIRVSVQVQEEARGPGVQPVDQSGEMAEVLVSQYHVCVHQSSS